MSDRHEPGTLIGIVRNPQVMVVTIWKSFHLPPFGSSKKVYSVLVVFGVILACSGYGWRIRPITSYEPSHLHQISNEELRETEKELSKEMRDYENNYGLSVNDFTLSRNSRDLRENTRGVLTKIRVCFLGKALALRDEMLWRLKKTPEQAVADVPATPEERFLLVDGAKSLSGFALGAKPISSVAMFLDALARELP